MIAQQTPRQKQPRGARPNGDGPGLATSHDPLWQCLAAMAVIHPDSHDVASMRQHVAAVSDWSDFAEQAESHGIAPIVSEHVRRHDIAIDPQIRRALNALVLRHRDANDVLNSALVNLLRVSQTLNLDAIVLKGSALAHMIYPQPGLRPRRDIDVLATPHQAMALQTALGESGYEVPQTHAVRAMRFHHHLPVASKRINGMTVSVEVHHDALSGDYPQRLTLGHTQDQPQSFMVDSTGAYAFGHRDMLTHLVYHALEPGGAMRLMTIADIVGYARAFNKQIDWHALRRSNPRVFNALTHLHYVRPLPSDLLALHPDPALPSPTGAGSNMPTLKQIFGQSVTHRSKLKQILFPSTWWMRAYYGAAPGAPLGRVRLFQHLPRVARWAGRRLLAQSVPR